MIGLFYIFTPQIVHLIAPAFSTGLHAMTVELTRLLLPMVFFSLLVSLDSVLLRNGHRYLLPEMIGFPMNLMMIGYLVFASSDFGVYGLTIAVVLGSLLQFLLQFFAVRKLDVRFRRLDFHFNDEGLKKMGVLVIPVLIGMSIQYVNFFVERILASGLVEGSISALTFGNRLSTFILGIVSVSIASVFYKSVSDLAAKADMDGLKVMVQRTLGMLVFLLVPATVGMMVLYLPITQLVFERGAFDAAASELTGGVFFWFSLGLIGYAVREMLTRAFYAMQDTKTAMINGGIAVALNAILCVVLTPVMEVNGLALSMSISGVFSALLLLISLRRKIGELGLKLIVVMSGKVVVASGIMGAVVWWLQGAGLFVSVAFGAAVYVGLVWLMRVRELDVFLGFLKLKR
jgi:putative peptidoglycan lipid II flippase